MRKIEIKMKITAVVLMAFLSAVPAQAEWFDKGSAAYRTLDGKWRRAAINVEPGKIEVFNRKDRTAVASFTKGEVEHGIRNRRRGRQAAGVGIIGAGIIGAAAIAVKQDEDVVRFSEDQGAYQRKLSGKRIGIALGVIAGIAAAIAVTKAREPYTEITDGPRSIRLRVGKDDLVRFESSLQGSIE